MQPEADLRVLNDAELERLAAAGHRDAFGELYERHCPRVYDYLLRIVRNPDDAADLMQETFVRAMNALSPERAAAASFTTWLFKIAHNLALSRVERGRRTVPLAAPGDGETPTEYAEQHAPRSTVPSEVAEVRELSALVWEAAAALEPRQYSLLDLHVRQGLDSSEIAQVLGVSKGNAYTMVSRLKDTFESAVAGLVMFRRGRQACPALDRLLEERRAITVSPAIRKLIDQHTKECDTCQDQRRRLVSATALLRVVPLAPLPFAIKERVGSAAAHAIFSPAGASAAHGATALGSTRDAVVRTIRGPAAGGVKTLAVLVAAIAVALVPIALPEREVGQPSLADVAAADTGPAAPSGADESRSPEAPSPAPASQSPATAPMGGAIATGSAAATAFRVVVTPVAVTTPAAPPAAVPAPSAPIPRLPAPPAQPTPTPAPAPAAKGIPDKNPSHAPNVDAVCEKRETGVRTTPGGNRVNIPCHAAESSSGH